MMIVRWYVVLFFISISSAVLQAGPLELAQFIQPGTVVNPRFSVDAWKGQPSRYLGTMLKKKVGQLVPDRRYIIKQQKLIPSVTGNQLWLKVQPVENDSSPCAKTGCWTFYGITKRSKPVESASGNFKLDPPKPRAED